MFLIKQDYVNNKSYDTLNNLYNVIKNEEILYKTSYFMIKCK